MTLNPSSGGARQTARLLLAGVAAPVVFVGSFLIQGALRPDYDPLRHPVSSLSLGPGGWVQQVTFWITGALVLACALGLRRAGLGRAAPILIGLVGIGLVGAGVFPADPISGYPPGSPIPYPRTVSGTLHNLFSTPVFTALPAAMVVLAGRFRRRGHRVAAIVSLCCAPVFFTFFVLAAVGFGQNPALMPYAGLCQRLALTIGLGWLAGAAALVRRDVLAGSATS